MLFYMARREEHLKTRPGISTVVSKPFALDTNLSDVPRELRRVEFPCPGIAVADKDSFRALSNSYGIETRMR